MPGRLRDLPRGREHPTRPPIITSSTNASSTVAAAILRRLRVQAFSYLRFLQ